MALEELLRQQDQTPADRASEVRTETKGRETLIRRVDRMMGMTVEGASLPEDTGGEEPPRCGDGYIRRSPVQPYRVAEDYHMRLVRKAVLIVVGAFLAVLLVIALIRAGLLRF